MFAESCGAAHRPAADPQRHVRCAKRYGAKSLSRQRRAGAPSRGDHDRGSAEAEGLRHRHRRQMAPGTLAAVPADASGLRRLVRSAVLARHEDDRRARQRLRDRGVLRSKAGILERAAREERRGDRAAGGPSHADEALHGRGRAFHRRQQNPAVLPLLCALDAAHSARPLGRLRGPQRRRHLRRRRRRNRLECGTHSRRAAGGRHRQTHAGRLHERQRTVAAVQNARRIGRSVEQRQGHDLGGRRADAGDLLVARYRAPVNGDRHGVRDGPVRHRREACRRGCAIGPGDRWC